MSLKSSDKKLAKTRGTVTIKEASFDEPPPPPKPPLKLENRIENFKNDPEQMEDLEKFINEILENATIEAEKKRELNKTEQSNQRSSLINSTNKLKDNFES
ncbi:uncharacterized protein LOC129609209 isoform X2 [Condylostylus longicornis]|uniref:uncharacterized protein LOC129609209 isoform X2 n=1 Tax=Condylostylus longicornis TaxID=2530218 RepID=UPI00244DEE4B|nr:uncharacterized protein LOC129609209 isoform X2 [Condylostylus longicornis]